MPEESGGLGSPRAGVIGDYDAPDVSAGYSDFCKSSTHVIRPLVTRLY